MRRVKRQRREEANATGGDTTTGQGLEAGPSMLSNAMDPTIDRSNLNNVRGNMTVTIYNYNVAGVPPKANMPSTSAGDAITISAQDPGATRDDKGNLNASKRRRSNDEHACGVQVVPSESTTAEGSIIDSLSQEPPTGYEKVVLEVSLDNLECLDMLKDSMMSAAERYTRLQLSKRLGYPLYLPEPDYDLPLEYRETGVRIGDVGTVSFDGDFDFLFNVCLPAEHPANPSVLPDVFEPVICKQPTKKQIFEPGDIAASESIEQIDNPPQSFRCSASEGAILVLPDGAVLYKAKDKRPFRDFAARHAESLYRYMIQQRGRDVPNGSLYIITGCIKSKSWGIATFDRQSQPNDHLKFNSVDVPMGHAGCMSASCRKYYWKQKGLAIARTGPNDIVADGVEMLNQCTFLRGYKVTLQEEVWEQLVEPIHVPVTGASHHQEYSPRLASDQDAAHGNLEQAHSEQIAPTSGYGVKHVTIEDDWDVSDAIHTVWTNTFTWLWYS